QCTSGNGCQRVGGGYAATDKIFPAGKTDLMLSSKLRKSSSPLCIGSTFKCTPASRGCAANNCCTSRKNVSRHFALLPWTLVPLGPPIHGSTRNPVNASRNFAICRE